MKRELLPGQEEQSISRIASVAVVVACVYRVYLLLHEERGGGQKLQVGVLENFQIIIYERSYSTSGAWYPFKYRYTGTTTYKPIV